MTVCIYKLTKKVMPNDENTQPIQQNWNSVVDPNASSNSWNSDDFDFSFDSELGSSVWNNQNQIVSQGRTWMFLTPDEEAEKEELQNSWQTMSQANAPVEDSSLWEDSGSYFPNVNINSDSIPDDTAGENSGDKFDDKIENMISFDDDKNSESTNTETVWVNVNEIISENETKPVETWWNNDMWWLIMQDQQVDENQNINNTNIENTDVVESNLQDTVEPSVPTDVVDWTTNVQGDDWLQQEDKKVEETFGSENVENNQSIEVNETPAEVAQNVESLFNKANSGSENNVVGSNDGWINDTSLPEGLGQQTDSQPVEGNYVPNEAEFSAMSNLLNSSSAWQVDLNNVSNQPEDNTWVLNNTFTSDVMPIQWNSDGTLDNSLQSPVNPVEQEVNSVEQQNVQPDFPDQPNPFEMQNQQEVVNNNMVNNSWVVDMNQPNQMDLQNPVNSVGPVEPSIDLNSIWSVWWVDLWNINNNIENQWMPLDAILDQEIQNMHVQPQNPGQVNNAWAVDMNQYQQQVQFQPQNVQTQNGKRKKQSWFVALGVFLFVCLAIFVVFKMFPDKISKIFKNDIVVEYVTWNEYMENTETNTLDVEQLEENEDNESEELETGLQLGENDELLVEGDWEQEENNLEWWESNAEWNEQLSWDIEELDPNSLAWLLAEDGGTANIETSDETANLEESMQNVWNTEESSESNNTWTNNDEEFDPFAEIINVLEEEQSDSDKLNDYIEQWNFYKELWISNGDRKMEKYGEYIVVTATEELWKLENWEEIDNSVFGRLDEILESLK